MMCVIDASIVAAACFPEQYTDKARGLLTSGAALLAPDFILAELANVAWKHYMRKEVTQDEAAAVLEEMQRVPLQIMPMQPLIRPAFDLALTTGRSVYDCIYLTCAIERGCTMWTADRRLVVGLAQSPTRKHVRWIGSWVPST